MTKRQIRVLNLALAAKAWIRGENSSDAAVLSELARLGYLLRRRTETHYEYRPNPPAVEAARLVGLL